MNLLPTPVAGDPAPESAAPSPETPRRRIPNLGHALLFVSFAGMMLAISELLLIAIWGPPVATHGSVVTILHPKLQLAAEGATYAATLLMAWFLYPLLWHRGFLDGLQWRAAAARSQAGRLIALGFILGLVSAMVDSLLPTNKTPTMDQFFLRPTDAWVVTFFGAIVAPLFEEICFRGFLVPAIAIAYDWVSLPRTDEGRRTWQATTRLTPISLVFSAIVTSLLFAAIHGDQLSFAWGPLLVLFCISLVLTFIRVKTQSVAASTLVHAAYNSFIFIVMIFSTGGYRHLERLTH
jgi:membrane protease YdiL (CAAX protease family)